MSPPALALTAFFFALFFALLFGIFAICGAVKLARALLCFAVAGYRGYAAAEGEVQGSEAAYDTWWGRVLHKGNDSRPIVVFSANGNCYLCTARNWRRYRMPEGQRMTVLYDPADPHDAFIVRDALVSIAIGAFLLAFGIHIPLIIFLTR